MSNLGELVTELSGMDGGAPAKKGTGMTTKTTKKKATKKKAAKKKTRKASAQLGDGSTLSMIQTRARRLRRDNSTMSQQEAVGEASKQLRAEGKIGKRQELARRAKTAPAAPSSTRRARVQSMTTPMAWMAPWAVSSSAKHSGETLAIASALVMQTTRMYDAAFELGNGKRKSETVLEMMLEPMIMQWIIDMPNTPDASKKLVRKFFEERNLLLLRMDPSGRSGGSMRGTADWLDWLHPNDRQGLLRHLADWRRDNEFDVAKITGISQQLGDLTESAIVELTLAAKFNLEDFPEPNEMNGLDGGGGFGKIRNSRMGWPSVPRTGQVGSGGQQYGNVEPDTMDDVRAEMAHDSMGNLGASASTMDLFLTLDDPFAPSSLNPLGDGSGVGFDSGIRPEDEPFAHVPGSLFGAGDEPQRLPVPDTAEEQLVVGDDDPFDPSTVLADEETGFVPVFSGGADSIGDDNDAEEGTFGL